MRLALALLLATSFAMPAQGQGDFSYEVTVNSLSGAEIRFHGLQVRSVQADDNQNALALNFLQPADGAVFERLAGELPLWIAMAYANFDNGVIRSNRAVSYLVRAEGDGFVLRLIPRGQLAPFLARTDPAPIRGSYTGR